MVGVLRTRTRQGKDFSYAGTASYPGVTDFKANSPDSETCVDIVGNPKGQNGFDLTSYKLHSATQMYGKKGAVTFDGYPCALTQATTFGDAFVTEGIFRDWTQAIADTHPGDPMIELPVFLFELRDVPHMLQHAKDRALKLVPYLKKPTLRGAYSYLSSGKARAEDWLNFNFGWRPFINDLQNLLPIMDYKDKLRRQYKRAQKVGYIRTRASCGIKTGHTTGNTPVFSGGGITLSSNQRISTKEERWVVGRWRFDPITFGEPLTHDIRSQIIRAYGLDVNVYQAWEAMPWSWLIDWFTNAGALIHLKGHRNLVSFDSAVKMTHTISEAVASGNDPSVMHGTYHRTKERKQRSLLAPSFLPKTGWNNIFQPGHLATLASLAVTRSKGAR